VEGDFMPKIVILGSCRHEPYEILAVPNKIPKAWNTEKGYEIASKKFYPAIDKADEVWVYAPDGIGEHTFRDMKYAKSKGKKIRFIALSHQVSDIFFATEDEVREVKGAP